MTTCPCGQPIITVTYQGDRAITVVGKKAHAPITWECRAGHKHEEWMTHDRAVAAIQEHARSMSSD